jgi:hypothetical protein
MLRHYGQYRLIAKTLQFCASRALPKKDVSKSRTPASSLLASVAK